jgi:hypothetical protein
VISAIIVAMLDATHSIAWGLAYTIRCQVFTRFNNTRFKWFYGIMIFPIANGITSILYSLALFDIIHIQEVQRVKFGVGWICLAIFSLFSHAYLSYNLFLLSKTLTLPLNRFLIFSCIFLGLVLGGLSLWCWLDPKAWISPLYFVFFLDLTVFNVLNQHLSTLFRSNLESLYPAWSEKESDPSLLSDLGSVALIL